MIRDAKLIHSDGTILIQPVSVSVCEVLGVVCGIGRYVLANGKSYALLGGVFGGVDLGWRFQE
jgi:hypothetical protein